MGIENPVHLLFIAAVALVVLGPKRLPDLARALGQGIREFRESLAEGSSPAARPLLAEPPVEQQPETPQSPPGEQQPLAPAPAPLAAEPAPLTAEPAPLAAEPAPGRELVDPTGPLRSGDAPDRRTL
ncbi:MAG: twin-arginine translocase TatA/TatE family subunit [Solirubrobacteraceae bacterium]|jgi:TatA/E family protein of Tat protein translocase